ncbi:MAG TPA: phage baseplate assembly protein V, partial [bacterium]|nr:phage baseplate assembly protein V [bacterium]
MPLVQKVVRHELQKLRVGELGVVTSVFPHTGKDDYNNYECNVKLKNSAVNGSELELRKVPIATGVIGMAAAPNVGDLVLIAFIRGEVNQPIITGRLYNDEDRPPVHNSNEFIHRLPLQEKENKTLKLELRNIQKNDPPREFLVSMPERVTLQVNDKQVLGEVDKTRVRISQPGGSDGMIT